MNDIEVIEWYAVN